MSAILEHRIGLSGKDWRICSAKPGTSREEATCSPSWIPAAVPGNVQSDIESAKLIKPIWYGPLDDNMSRLALNDWWYQKEFELTPEQKGKRITLLFYGVDYSCDVYVNGRHAGSNEGSFKRFRFDVTDLVRPGKNLLQVKVDAMPEELFGWIQECDGKMSGEGTDHFFVLANNKIRQTLKGLKCPGNCSYDWGTNIYTLGIWKEVFLCVTEDVRADFIQAKGLLNESYTKGTADITLELNSKRAAKIKVVSELKGNGLAEEKTAEFEIPAGESKVNMTIPVDQPALWWPNGYGEHPLYDVKSEIYVDGILSDEIGTRIGFRDIQWEATDGAPADLPNKFGLVLNGKRIRTMGSCLTVTDLLHGRSGANNRFFAEMAKECNMTALRHHGGQIIMHDNMYDACDEMGIMLLFDFPIGNCCLETDEEFLKNLDETIRNIVKQIRNHASIMEWTGGNELDYYFNPGADREGVEVERRATEGEDDTRLFRDTCPVEGSRHAPWDYNADLHYNYYNSDLKDNKGVLSLMRYGEFGCQTPSNLEVWYRDFPVASQWPLNEEDPTQWRKNALNAVFDTDYWLRPSVIERFFGKLDNLEMTIKGGQYLAGEGMRYAIDALRARGKRIGGFTSWDYNEPWPNGAGSYVIDYDGRPVMMYRFMQEALEPVALQLKYDSIFYSLFRDNIATLRIVADIPERLENLHWAYTQRDRRGNVYGQGSGMVSIDSQEVIELCELKINPPQNMGYGPAFIELSLKNSKGDLLAQREYVFCAEGVQAPLRSLVKREGVNDHEFGIPYVTTGIKGQMVYDACLEVGSTEYRTDETYEYLSVALKNTGAMTALFVEAHPLLNYRTDLIIRDNFLSIPPQEERTLLIKAHKGGEMTLAQTGFNITCFNGETVTVKPSDDVLLYMGRRDCIAREFKGYFDAAKDQTALIKANGREIKASEVCYLAQGKTAFAFEANTNTDTKLRIHIADSSVDPCRTTVSLNGRKISEITLNRGYGVQKDKPDHLAYPETYEIVLPGAVFKKENLLEIETKAGWFTWDAMDIVR